MMIKITRLINLIVCFQLFWSCSDGAFQVVNRKIISNDTVELSGSIAKTLNTLSNVIFPSAMAASGKLVITNIDDPQNEFEIHSEHLNNLEYRIQLKKDDVENHLISIKFYSDDDSDKDRTLLINVNQTKGPINGSMDENSSVKSKVIHEQLKMESEQNDISQKQRKQRFAVLKESTLDAQLNIFGDKNMILKLLADKNYSSSVVSILAYHKMLSENSKFEEMAEVEKKLMHIGIEAGLIKDGVLNCDDKKSGPTFLNVSNLEYKILFFGNAEVFNHWGEVADFGSVNDGEKAKEVFDLIKMKLVDLEKDQDLKNAAGKLVVIGPDKSEQSCELNASSEVESAHPYAFDPSIINSVNFKDYKDYDEAKVALSGAYDKTKDDIRNRMIADKMDEDAIVKAIDEQLPAIKELYENLDKELYDMFNSKG